MPRFFFHVHDGVEVVDPVGQELADLDAARRHAMAIAADYTREPRMLRSDGGAIVVDVRDEAGSEVLAVRLVFTVEIKVAGSR